MLATYTKIKPTEFVSFVESELKRKFPSMQFTLHILPAEKYKSSRKYNIHITSEHKFNRQEVRDFLHKTFKREDVEYLQFRFWEYKENIYYVDGLNLILV